MPQNPKIKSISRRHLGAGFFTLPFFLTKAQANDFNTLKIKGSKRDARYAAIASGMSQGSIVEMAGLFYIVDSNAGGTLSATHDLGVNGLLPYESPSPLHFSGVVNSASIQQAVDYSSKVGENIASGEIVTVPNQGKITSFKTVFLRRDVEVNLAKTYIDHHGDVAFDIGWNASLRVADAAIRGGRIELKKVGAVGIRVQNAYGPYLIDNNIRLFANDQVGVCLRGNASPFGPYYGTIDRLRVAGNASTAISTGQIGLALKPSNSPSTSNGINRWQINFRHIVSVDIGVDVEAAHGLSVTSGDLENIHDTGIRFNNRPNSFGNHTPDYIGTVTATGAANQILDALLKNKGPCSVIVTSGLNAGFSSNSSIVTDGSITTSRTPPYPYAFGDSYAVYLAKALDVSFRQITCETAKTMVDFKAGARNCNVEFTFATIAPSSTYFTRQVEDFSNTIARRYEIHDFEGVMPIGGGVVWLEPAFTKSGIGGIILPRAGFIDQVSATASQRGQNESGTILIEPMKGGLPDVPELGIKLTPHRSNNAEGVRKSLIAGGFVRQNQTIQIRASGTQDLTKPNYIRVQLRVGFI